MHAQLRRFVLCVSALLSATAVRAQSNYATPYAVSLLAGYRGIDGTGSDARFNEQQNVAVDGNGNIYVADTGNHTIRKITSAGVVSTLAGLAGVYGSADGTGNAARFRGPRGVAVDLDGNVYVADSENYTLRKISSAGVVTTLAGVAGDNGSVEGAGAAARFGFPDGIALDGTGNIYVADYGNHSIRKVTNAGAVTTLAGSGGLSGSVDGTGSAARFNHPTGIAVDGSGNVYVADTGNHTARKISSSGAVTTLAGAAGSAGTTNGTGSAARFNGPRGVAVDTGGNAYVADAGNHTIRKITAAGAVTTFAGTAGSSGSTDATGSVARFNFPYGVAMDGGGNIYVADTGNLTVRRITSAAVVTTLAGATGISTNAGSSDGAGSASRFSRPRGMAVDTSGNVYVADASNHTIRKISTSGIVTTVAGAAGISGSTNGTGSAARFNNPYGVAVDAGGTLYVADMTNSVIRKITTAGVVTTLAGTPGSIGSTNGTGSAARFNGPFGLAVDASGNVYVADTFNYTIRKITSAGVVTTLAGSAGSSGGTDGTGSAARFDNPAGVALDSSGNIYVAEVDNHTIRKITSAGVVTTLAGAAATSGSIDGSGSAARFNQPSGLAVDGSGNVYVADSFNSEIRKISSAGLVTTLAGAVAGGSAEGMGASARFNLPFGVAVGATGTLYIADGGNNLIRKAFVLPQINSAISTDLTATSVLLGGNLTHDGTSAVTERGIVLAVSSTNSNPQIGGPGVTKVISLDATALFTTTVTGLAAGTAYNYAAYATNASGTSYTSVASFTTLWTNANLLALGLSAGTLAPAFASAATSYTATVAYAEANITVTPIADQPNATLQVRLNGGTYATVASATASSALPLSVGSNTIEVKVTAQDATTVQTYTIAVTRSAPAPAEVDTAFNPNPSGEVDAIAVQPDGKLVIGGFFSSIGGVTGRNRIARLNTDGTYDTGFNVGTGANDAVYCAAVQSDGKVIVGGPFTTINGTTRNRIARLNVDGSVDTSFNPNANATVASIAVQTDGKIVIGGEFTTVGGTARNYVARLNADGTLDTGFNPNASNSVFCVIPQPDGKIVIVGGFTTMGGTTRNRVARVSSTGSLDASFNPNAGNIVESAVVQPDGKILLAGQFTTLGGITRNRIARVNADGSLDTGFNPNANNTVHSLVLQTDGKVVLGGLFTTIGGTTRNRAARVGSDGALDTGFDPNVSNNIIYSVGIQADGSVLLGGTFTTVGSSTRNNIARLANDAVTRALSVVSTSRVQWLRGGAGPEVGAATFELSTDGGSNWSSLGSGTRVSGGWELTGLSLPASGSLRARGRTTGGYLSSSSGLIEQVQAFAPSANANLSGLAVNFGALVPVFAAATSNYSLNLNYSITSLSLTPIAVQSDATVQARVNGSSFVNVASGVASSGLALQVGSNTVEVRITAQDGTTVKTYTITVTRAQAIPGDLDPGFDPNTDNESFAIGPQADGKILLGGFFTKFGSTTRNHVARLNADGALDTAFNPDVNGYVVSIAAQTDAKIIIGGSFGAIGGTTRNFLARLNADGSLDSAFNANVNGRPNAIALQSDGKILLGGQFTTVGVATRNRVARLNADGSLDVGFNPNANGDIYAVAVQADGKILLGGTFTSLGGSARNNIARVNADGSLDATFDPNANASIAALAIQADGKILLGSFGGLTTIGGLARNNVARLNADGSVDPTYNPNANSSVSSLAIQADGKVVLGGHFSMIGGVGRPGMARLNADGSLDSAFYPSPAGNVDGVSLQADGSVLIAGDFTAVGVLTRNRVARLVNDTASQTLNIISTSRVQWMRSGAGPECVSVAFELSTDGGVTWSTLGGGARISGGWELTGLALPLNGSLRARGRTTGGYQNATSGFIEQVQAFSQSAAPTVASATSANITATDATLGGNVTNDGNATITERGVVVALTSSNSNPQIGGTGVTKITVTGTTGVFTATATGLTPNTGYTFAAYATNSVGTSYSSTATFTTAVAAPAVTNSTLAASGTYGSAFSTYTITGSNSPTSYSAVGLPAGLSLNTSTGEINGTPTTTVGSPFSVTIGATNAGGTGTDTLVITVAKAPLTVTADAKSKNYGSANPTLTATLSGFVNGDSAASGVTGSPSLTTTATSASAVGNASITAAIGTLAATNYTFSNFVAGTLAITKAPLTVTADAKSKVYGAAVPALSASLSGFVNGETLATSGVTGAASVTTTATAATGAGSATLTPTVGTLAASNYSFTAFVNGTLTITKAPLTVTADAKTKVYGAANPALTASLSGFVNGETLATSGVSGAAGVTTTATAATGAGSATLTPTAGTLAAANYSFASLVDGTLTITKASLTVKADDKTRLYGAANPTFTATITGFVNGDPASVVSGAPSFSTTAAANSPAGGYPISASVGTLTAANYDFVTFTDGNLNVGPTILTVTADAKTRTYGTANPALTLTYAGFVGTDSAASLTTAPTASTTATATSAPGSYAITVGGGASTNYTFNYVAGALTVTAADQTISFAALAGKTYGDASFGLGASASSGLTPTFTVVSGPASISGSTVTLTGAGDVTIEAAQAGNTNYAAATPVQRTFTVAKKTLTLTAEDKSRVYGAANPILTTTISGLVGSDTASVITGTPVVTTSATAASNAGAYALVAGGTLSAANYAFAFVDGTLTVTKAPLTVAADNKTRLYGAANPSLTASMSGFVNGDTAVVVTGTPTASTSATATSPVGSYAIAAGGALSATNYTFNFVAGALTVAKAPLTVRADDKTRLYGAANPALTVSYSGFANGETSAVLSGAPTLATTATAASNVGSFAITLSAATLAAQNYSFTLVDGTLAVTKAPLTVTADDKTRLFGAANPAFTATITGFVNGDSASVVSGAAAFATTATTTSNVGTYPINVTAASLDAANYEFATFTPGTLNVGQVTLTVTADNKSRPYGAANPTLTLVYAGFVGTDTAASLTVVPVASTTATSASAAGTYPITVGGGGSTNYAFNYVPGTLTVTPAEQAITFAVLTGKTYGDAAFDVAATASSGLPVAFSIVSGPAALSGATVTLSGAGTVVVRATQAGDGNYNAAPAEERSFAVARKTLLVTADDKSRSYGAPSMALTATFSGFVNGDTASVITGTPVLSTTATATSGVGTYAIAAAGALSAANYDFAFADGTLTITKAHLTVTADAKARVYGGANPALSSTITGFVNGETAAVVSGAPLLSTNATTASAVGAYALVPASGSLAAANYDFSFVNGTLSVTPAPLIARADDKQRTYGATNPALTVSYNGFVNGDTTAVLAGAPVIATTATVASNAGAHPITLSLATLTAQNYSIQPVDGTLTVTKAPLTVTADNKTRAYGGANPAFTAAISGFVNGDTSAAISGAPAFATTAAAASAVGSYPIVVTAGSLAANNYAFSYVDGVLTVGVAPLIVTANNQTRPYGAANPALTLAYTGFVGSDTAANLQTAPTAATTASAATTVGSYPITVGGGADANYAFSYVSGTLTITPATQTLTFAAITDRVFGDAPFALTATASSGLPVAFTVVNGPATLNGGTLSLTGAGNVTVRASQPGNGNYSAATSIERSFGVAKAPAQVVLANLTATFNGAPKTVTATTTPSNLGVIVTYGGSEAPPTAVGSYAVVATINDANYQGSASGTLVISAAVPPPPVALASQTVTFASIGNPGISGTATLSATASSGLPVTFSVVSGPASIAGNVLTVTGPGTVLVRATQSGNAVFAAASADQSFTVSAPVGNISLSGLSHMFDGSAKAATVTTTPSGLAVSVTYAGSATPPTNAGSYAVVATITGTGFTGSATGTLTIAKASQTITFSPLADRTTTAATLVLSAAASSGLPVTFSVSGVATLANGVVTLSGAPGLVSVTATQAGNGNYESASVTRSFTVAAPSTSTFFSGLNGNGGEKRGDIAFAFPPNSNQGALVIVAPGLNLTTTAQVTLEPDGSFTITLVVDLPGVAAASDSSVPRRAASLQTITIQGQRNGDLISGRIDQLGVSFSSRVEAPTGATAALAGFYSASAVNSASGGTTAIVGAQGQMLVVTQVAGATTGVATTIDVDGTFKATATATTITGAIDGSRQTITGTVGTGSQTVDFSGVAAAAARTDRIANLSSRASIVPAAGRALITGFVIAGTEPQRVLLRAIGPALTGFGVNGAAVDPALELFDARGARVLQNDNWAGTDTASAAVQAGAFALTPGARDAAIVATLAPGAYTMQVAIAGTSGVALAEIYDADTGGSLETHRLVNISSRGSVDVGDGALIGGFVITGNVPKRVLVRGAGPGLAAFGVAGVLTDPRVAVYLGGTMVAQNNDWETPTTVGAAQTAATAAEISDAARNAGAFAFTAGSKDAAVLVTLAPGAYTAQVSGAGTATGVALVEIYEVP